MAMVDKLKTIFKSYADAINSKATVSQIYPVGSIYMSVNDVDPSTLFGGTWERLQDQFLVGAGSSFDAGTTGGLLSTLLLVLWMVIR